MQIKMKIVTLCVLSAFGLNQYTYAAPKHTKTDTSSTQAMDDYQPESFVVNDIKASGMEHTNGLFVLQSVNLKQGMSISESNFAQLQQKLMETGFFQSIHLSRNDNDIIIAAVENPTIRDINITGNKSFRTRELLANMQKNHIHKGLTYSQVMLNQYTQSLSKQYFLQGRQHAEVKATTVNNNDGTVNIQLEIVENPSTKINAIKFEGNQAFSDKELLRLMKLSPKGGTNFITDKLDQNKLRSDLENVVDFYHEHGYFEAGTEDVKFVDVNTQQSNKNPMQDIVVYLKEGKPYHFAQPKVQMSDNPKVREILSDAVLEKNLLIRDGDLYQKSKVINSMQNLNNVLANNGFAFAKVDVQPEVENEQKVKFVFSVQENTSQTQKINRYNIRFLDANGNVVENHKTQDYVVLREMRQNVGDVYDLSKIQRSKERLDLTGYFNQVSMATQKVEGDNDLVDVNIDIQERKTGAVQASIGYMQDYGFNAGIGISDRNFRGTGQSLGANLNYNKVNRSAELNYQSPFMFKMGNQGVSLDSSIYGSIYDPRKENDTYQSYRSTRYGAKFNFGIPLFNSEYNKIYTGLDIEHMTLNTYSDAPQRYRQFIQEHGKNNGNGNGVGKFSGWLPKLTVGWGRNTTNHAYWPTRGYMVNVDGEVTVPGVSKLNYYKVGSTAKYFMPVGKSGAALMIGGRIGYANSYGSTKELPFFENYYGGGLGFVRGFESGTLGPKIYNRNGNIITYGGNKIAGVTMEVQSPLPSFMTKDSSNVRVSAFLDAGAVWDSKTYSHHDSDNGVSVYRGNTHHSSFRNELRASAGLAWTWLSPMGPVKFSYAIPIKKKQEDQIQKFQFQLGTTF